MENNEVDRIRQALNTAWEETKNVANKYAHQAGTSTRDQLNEAASQARVAGREIDYFTRRNVWPMMVVSLLVGLIVGILSGSRRRD